MFIINIITLFIYITNINLIIKNFVTFLINKDCPYLLFHSLTEILLIYILIYFLIFILLNYLFINFKIFQKQSIIVNLMVPYLIAMTLKEIYYITLSLTSEKLMFEFHLYYNLKMIILISFYIFLIQLYLKYIRVNDFFKSDILLNQLFVIFIIILNILPPQLLIYFLIFILILYNIELNKKKYINNCLKSNFARSRI